MSGLDILVVAAHPDDAELFTGGLILSARAAGLSVGIIDLTRGEMGTRGSAEERSAESAAATALMDLQHRQNLDLGDAGLVANLTNRNRLACELARLKPRVVIGHPEGDAHPDHAAASQLMRDAWYVAGLQKLIEKLEPGLTAHRPSRLFHFSSGSPCASLPSLVVDIGDVFQAKQDLLRCYASQLNQNGSSDAGEHFMLGADILARSEINALYWGSQIGVPFGEPLYHRGPLPADVIGLLR